VLNSSLGPTPLIRVPGDIQFNKGVLDCQRLVTPHQACSHDKLVDMEATLATAVGAVDDGLPRDERVAPLVFARLARGGKTTFLCELFDRLRAGNKAVTLITLLNLTRRADEDGRDTLLRLIALQLLPQLQFSAEVNV